MPPKTRLKTAATATPVPQTRDAVNAAITEFGGLITTLSRMELDMKDEMVALKAGYESQAEPLRQRQRAILTGAQIWGDAHREAETQGGRTKTIAFAAGTLSWRLTTPKVNITGVKDVIEQLEALGLENYLRRKPAEIDKTAIAAAPWGVADIAGISISQIEEFAIEPFGVSLLA